MIGLILFILQLGTTPIFGWTYDVTVMSAVSLPQTDIWEFPFSDEPDPYVYVTITCNVNGVEYNLGPYPDVNSDCDVLKTVQQTSVVEGTNDPYWDETFTYGEIPGYAEITGWYFAVFDEDGGLLNGEDDFMGYVNIETEDFIPEILFYFPKTFHKSLISPEYNVGSVQIIIDRTAEPSTAPTPGPTTQPPSAPPSPAPTYAELGGSCAVDTDCGYSGSGVICNTEGECCQNYEGYNGLGVDGLSCYCCFGLWCDEFGVCDDVEYSAQQNDPVQNRGSLITENDSQTMSMTMEVVIVSVCVVVVSIVLVIIGVFYWKYKYNQKLKEMVDNLEHDNVANS